MGWFTLWLWIEPEDGIAIAEYEALAAALSRHENLHLAVSDLLRYEWLPAEGRDFTVKYDRSTANGVSIECEVFYPARDRSLIGTSVGALGQL